ncbi:MAG: hypothetical protein KDK51_06330 [Deltaproteobacteria bacterium]|nr:hypothetical protein [Deltaproteobacteria bacterium]
MLQISLTRSYKSSLFVVLLFTSFMTDAIAQQNHDNAFGALCIYHTSISSTVCQALRSTEDLQQPQWGKLTQDQKAITKKIFAFVHSEDFRLKFTRGIDEGAVTQVLFRLYYYPKPSQTSFTLQIYSYKDQNQVWYADWGVRFLKNLCQLHIFYKGLNTHTFFEDYAPDIPKIYELENNNYLDAVDEHFLSLETGLLPMMMKM